jgi:membrane protease subunit HflK
MRKGLLLLLIILLASYVLTGVVQVRPGERAVVRRFGRVLPEAPGPGLWVGLPWGMDRVDRVVVDQVRQVVVGYQEDSEDRVLPAGQVLTGDHNLVNLQVVLFYSVRPDEVAAFVVHEGRVAELLARAVEASMAEWVGSQNVDEVLLRGKVALRADLLKRLPGRLEDYRLGVEVRDVRVALVAPPEEVRVAFDQVARAQTDRETRKTAAQQEALSALRRAEGKARRTVQAARSDAQKRVALDREKVNGFLLELAQYRAARAGNPAYVRHVWAEKRAAILRKMKRPRGLELLDHHLSPQGTDLYSPIGPRAE